jgi:hypothetical protein
MKAEGTLIREQGDGCQSTGWEFAIRRRTGSDRVYHW